MNNKLLDRLMFWKTASELESVAIENPNPKRFPKKRVVPVEGGSETLEIWDDDLKIWVLYIDFLLDDGSANVDIDQLEDVSDSEPFDNEPVKLEGLGEIKVNF